MPSLSTWCLVGPCRLSVCHMSKHAYHNAFSCILLLWGSVVSGTPLSNCIGCWGSCREAAGALRADWAPAPGRPEGAARAARVQAARQAVPGCGCRVQVLPRSLPGLQGCMSKSCAHAVLGDLAREHVAWNQGLQGRCLQDGSVDNAALTAVISPKGCARCMSVRLKTSFVGC